MATCDRCFEGRHIRCTGKGGDCTCSVCGPKGSRSGSVKPVTPVKRPRPDSSRLTWDNMPPSSRTAPDREVTNAQAESSRRPVVRDCGICGTEFRVGDQRRSVYCGPGCASLARKRNMEVDSARRSGNEFTAYQTILLRVLVAAGRDGVVRPRDARFGSAARGLIQRGLVERFDGERGVVRTGDRVRLSETGHACAKIVA